MINIMDNRFIVNASPIPWGNTIFLDLANNTNFKNFLYENRNKKVNLRKCRLCFNVDFINNDSEITIKTKNWINYCDLRLSYYKTNINVPENNPEYIPSKPNNNIIVHNFLGDDQKFTSNRQSFGIRLSEIVDRDEFEPIRSFNLNLSFKNFEDIFSFKPHSIPGLTQTAFISKYEFAIYME
jgi:hypothetical protein